MKMTSGMSDNYVRKEDRDRRNFEVLRCQFKLVG